MNRALLIGINRYEFINSLRGCANDATTVEELLRRNGDGSKNYGTKLYEITDQDPPFLGRDIKNAARELFKDSHNLETVLFYFSGHGYVTDTGGYILGSDSQSGDDGFSMADLLLLARNCNARHKIIILDCCHAGFAGKNTGDDMVSSLSPGMIVLTSSEQNQFSVEKGGAGLFTSLLVDALQGGAANILGEITPGAIYAYIDQSLGEFEQRPLFKANISKFIPLRKVTPAIDLRELRKITALFPHPEFHFPLDPTYEFTFEADRVDAKRKKKIRDFQILQKYNRLNLVKPHGAEHMYFAAIDSKTCYLTALGKFYWRLVDKGRI